MRQLFIKAKTIRSGALLIALGLCMTGFMACAGDGVHNGPGGNGDGRGGKGGSAAVFAADTSIKLPSGFTAMVVADKLGKARHIAVTGNGIIYVKMAKLKDGGSGIYKLEGNMGDGKMKAVGFGNFPGTGMAIRNGYLYASSDEEVFRYKLDGNGNVLSPDQPEKIVTGLIARNEHEPKAVTLDYNGNLYVNIGAFSNSCQVEDRTKGSLGINPCPVLDSAAGIWKFKADKLNQGYGDGVRYATGLRNVVGLDWNTVTNTLFVMQHGRDQLNTIAPDLYDSKQNAELPAECMYELHEGSNCGWPYIYYDPFQHKKILAPEYGGDGKKTGGDNAQDPVMAFPAHMAPDGLLFYTGNQFPAKYKNGAFICFHGSWNRAPEPQKGFLVAFVPFKDGKPSGDWEIFADNFSGSAARTATGRAQHRPCGITQGPDGSIYVTDDSQGTVWKISYK